MAGRRRDGTAQIGTVAVRSVADAPGWALLDNFHQALGAAKAAALVAQ